eukprot:Skav231025  [mRNA]  locus=scaffold1869:130422:133653:- [translate_table: standard]
MQLKTLCTGRDLRAVPAPPWPWSLSRWSGLPAERHGTGHHWTAGCKPHRRCTQVLLRSWQEEATEAALLSLTDLEESSPYPGGRNENVGRSAELHNRRHWWMLVGQNAMQAQAPAEEMNGGRRHRVPAPSAPSQGAASDVQKDRGSNGLSEHSADVATDPGNAWAEELGSADGFAVF